MLVDIFLFGVAVIGVSLIWIAIVMGLSKRGKSAAGGVARFEEAMMKSKDDPIEPARFVP